MTREAIAALVLSFSVACSGTNPSRNLLSGPEPCDGPGPVTGDPAHFDSVYMVGVQPGANVQAEAERLATECGFTVRQVFSFGQAFSAVLGPVELGCVRCDASVTSVEGNTV